MKRTALALTLVLVLLFSAVAGTKLVNWVEANPEPSSITSGGWGAIVVIISPENKTYHTKSLTLSINAGSHLGLFYARYSVDGGPFTNIGQGDLPLIVNENISLTLSEGSHTIVARANSWGAEVCANVSFTIDTIPPSVPIMSPEIKAYNTTDVPLEFTVNETVSQIKYSLDGQENVTIAGNMTLNGLPDGEHNVTVYACDTTGFLGSSETIYFTVDTVPPNVSVLSPTSSTYDTTEMQLNFTANEPLSKMEHSLDGQENVTITGNTTLTELPYGFRSLTVYCHDAAGNIGSYTIRFSTLPLGLIVAAVVAVAVVGAALLVYFKKRHR